MTSTLARLIGGACLVGLLVTAGCASDTVPTSPVPIATPSSVTSPVPASIPNRATAPPTPSAVTTNCFLNMAYQGYQQFTVSFDAAGKPDFGQPWRAQTYGCSGASRIASTASELEAARLSSSTEIGAIYDECATTIAPGYEEELADTLPPSESRVIELKAVLAICPSHPRASFYRRTIASSERIADAQASNRYITPGTHLVGSEVTPGTYISEGDIENCYWARQDDSGNVIENNFVPSARRVRVTIEASDYGFDSTGCGSWTGE